MIRIRHDSEAAVAVHSGAGPVCGRHWQSGPALRGRGLANAHLPVVQGESDYYIYGTVARTSAPCRLRLPCNYYQGYMRIILVYFNILLL